MVNIADYIRQEPSVKEIGKGQLVRSLPARLRSHGIALDTTLDSLNHDQHDSVSQILDRTL